ncbi:hypothetical protein [Photobacterium gaetbulicola]|uniref:hypothetical protein n=1 Tax=Photobacterium gaetbulicola TaxID=1295392 RepID=UPI001E4C788A|nr:hypothetical protein [Photobacterium gaetbulicola]
MFALIQRGHGRSPKGSLLGLQCAVHLGAVIVLELGILGHGHRLVSLSIKPTSQSVSV